MSRRSTVAVSTLTPALNVLSTTLPESTFFSLVRTNAGPLPGFTCWNSMIVHSWPSICSTRPFLKSLWKPLASLSFVSKTGYSDSRSLVVSVSELRVPAHDTTSVSSIRTPPRPERYTPGSTVTAMHRRAVYRCRACRLPELRGSPGPTPCPSPCRNCSPVARVLDDRRGPRRPRAAPRRPARSAARPGRLRGRHERRTSRAASPRGRPEHERPGHVRVVAVDRGAEVQLDEVAGGQRRPRSDGGAGSPSSRRPRRSSRTTGRRRRASSISALQFPADLPLGAARRRPPALDQVGERGVGGRARRPQQPDLGVVLDHPQPLDQPRRTDRARASRPSSGQAANSSTVTTWLSNPSRRTGSAGRTGR